VVDAGPCGGAWCLFSQTGNSDFEVTQGVFATGPDDAWATSYGSHLLHWNGSVWSMVSIADFDVIGYALWGTGPSDVLLGGDNGHNYRGPPFGPSTQIAGAASTTLVSVHGLTDGGSIHVGSDDGQLFRYDGGAWEPVDLGSSAPGAAVALRAIAVVAPDDVWVAGTGGTILHGTGAGWSRLDAGVTENLRRAWANGPGDVWFVGQAGRIVRWNGSDLVKSYCLSCGDLWGLWGRSSNDMWLADDMGALVHFDGGGFSPSINPVPGPQRTPGLWGAGDRDLFLSAAFDDGGYGVLHFRR
jgi:hypothetical protein